MQTAALWDKSCHHVHVSDKDAEEVKYLAGIIASKEVHPGGNRWESLFIHTLLCFYCHLITYTRNTIHQVETLLKMPHRGLSDLQDALAHFWEGPSPSLPPPYMVPGCQGIQESTSSLSGGPVCCLHMTVGKAERVGADNHITRGWGVEGWHALGAGGTGKRREVSSQGQEPGKAYCRRKMIELSLEGDEDVTQPTERDGESLWSRENAWTFQGKKGNSPWIQESWQ